MFESFVQVLGLYALVFMFILPICVVSITFDLLKFIYVIASLSVLVKIGDMVVQINQIFCTTSSH